LNWVFGLTYFSQTMVRVNITYNVVHVINAWCVFTIFQRIKHTARDTIREIILEQARTKWTDGLRVFYDIARHRKLSEMTISQFSKHHFIITLRWPLSDFKVKKKYIYRYYSFKTNCQIFRRAKTSYCRVEVTVKCM
jgi:hypothetical protein